MKNKNFKISILLIAILMATFGAYVIWTNIGPKNIGLSEAKQEFSLVHPEFAQSVAAATTFLDQEAGMSIYLNTGSAININALPSVVINIENKTSDWVIGSVNLGSGFTSSDYPHCFLHVSGWIVVYYLKATSQNTAYVSKMIVWKSNTEGLTANSPLDDDKLKQGLDAICTPLGIPTANAKYYDFQYPTATTLLIAVKTTVSTTPATFNIEIPSTGVNVSEQSWSHRNGYYTSDGSYFKIDGQQFDLGSPTTVTVASYGELPLIQNNPLATGSYHTIYVDGRLGWCGICLTILFA
jgi:hypothetical protein